MAFFLAFRYSTIDVGTVVAVGGAIELERLETLILRTYDGNTSGRMCQRIYA